MLSSNKAIRFSSIVELSTYLGCEDTRTGIKLLQQVCKRYHLRCQLSDEGVHLTNANVNLDGGSQN